VSEYSAYVGLDVHKDSIAVAVALPGRQEPSYRGEIRNDRKSLLRLIARLSPNGEVLSSATRRVRAAMVCTGRLSRRVTIARWWRQA